MLANSKIPTKETESHFFHSQNRSQSNPAWNRKFYGKRSVENPPLRICHRLSPPHKRQQCLVSARKYKCRCALKGANRCKKKGGGRVQNRTRPLVSLFRAQPPSLLNALHRYGETHFTRVRKKKKWRGNASPLYITRHRCGQMLCKQRVQHAIPPLSPSPSPFLSVSQTGHDHFVAIIHRAGTFMRAGAPSPSPPFLYDFFRVASPRRFARTHALKNVLSRRSFPPPRYSPMRNDPPRYILPPPPPPPFSTDLFGLRSFLGRVSIRESRFQIRWMEMKLEWNCTREKNVGWMIIY